MPPSRTSPSASIAACHAFFGTCVIASRTAAVMANPTDYSTWAPRLASCRVSQSSSPGGGAGAVLADQYPTPVRRRDLPDRRGEDLDVVCRSVRPGVAGAQHRGEHLPRVVAPDPERVVAEAALERRPSRVFLAVRGDQRRVHVEHDDIAQVGAGDPRGGDPARGVEPGPTCRRTRARACSIRRRAAGVS